MFKLKNIKRIYNLAKGLRLDGWQKAEYLKKNNILYHQGKECYFSSTNFGTEPYLISLGDNVYVATGVTFITHDMGAILLNKICCDDCIHDMVGPISIGNNVFIGANSTILMNVNIGSNCIIGAGSVVTKDIPDNTVVAGVPARKINDFSNYVEKVKNFSQVVPWTPLLKNIDTPQNEQIREKRIEYFWNEKGSVPTSSDEKNL